VVLESAVIRPLELARDSPIAERLVDYWIQIVRGEYLEIPSLLLTRGQVQRFWGLDGSLCDRVLEALIKAGFLLRTPGGFVRAGQTVE
jgi:hypothetical protein